MTAPKRWYGVTLKERDNGCWKKVRYTDRLAAKAAGIAMMERGRGDLWVYPCRLCGGFHLTSLRPGRKNRERNHVQFF